MTEAFLLKDATLLIVHYKWEVLAIFLEGESGKNSTTEFIIQVVSQTKGNICSSFRSLSPVSRDRDVSEEAGEEDGGQPLQLDQTNRKKKGKVG